VDSSLRRAAPRPRGKSAALRCLNRMNDLIRGFRMEGQVHFMGRDIYAPKVDPVAVRRYGGMVFQHPNPFAMSIFNNVAFGCASIATRAGGRDAPHRRADAAAEIAPHDRHGHA